jgi:hypothetical protein
MHNLFMKQVSPADHRIFGFTELGQLRVSLHNSADTLDAGAIYSWIVGTEHQIVTKLENWYSQPLSAEEWDVIEQLEAETEAEPMACEDCGGTGRDPGSLNAFEPEDCPSCNGTGQESEFPMLARRPAGRQLVAARQEVA